MPGIVGLITKAPREWAEPQVLRMVEALRHEPFYQTGTWCHQTLGVYVGWVAHKGCFSSAMPQRNRRGDVVLVFAGEDFSDPETNASLWNRGQEPEADGLSYLVRLYEEGRGFPETLNGRFHGLLVDLTARTATLFNDRYGMHRLYYHESGEGFYFAAEAKAILGERPELRQVDQRSFGEFVTCGCVLQDRTLFRGVSALPGGSAWRFQNGALERRSTYFQPREWEEQLPLEAEAYYEELKGSFARVLPRYFESPEPIGMSLTGGLDTRVVMAWQRRPVGSLPCYTYGGTFRRSRDVRVARMVANACRQQFHEIQIGGEFLSRFAEYAERSVYLTDGSVDLLRCPDLYLSQKARELAPVRMTGLYGDEVLRHARAFKPVMPAPGLFADGLVPSIRLAHNTYSELLGEHPLTFTAFRQAPWFHRGILALEQSQLTIRTPFLDNHVVRTVYQAPQSAVTNNRVRERLIRDGNPVLARIPTDRGFCGAGDGPWAGFRRQVHKFSFKAEYAYDYGMPQWLARLDHALAPLHLERLFLGRHKLLHFRVWYRDELASYVREVLLDRQTLARPYLNPRQVEAVVKGHTEGTANYTLEIHKLLTLELVHRQFIDSSIGRRAAPAGGR